MGKHVWQIPFYKESVREVETDSDNDDEEEEEAEEVDKKKKPKDGKADPNNSFEFFI